MAIYDIFNAGKSEMKSSTVAEPAFASEEEVSAEKEKSEAPEVIERARDRFFSSLCARLFFLLLLTADVIWVVYAFFLFGVSSLAFLMTVGKVECFKRWNAHARLSIQRSLVCGLSLFIALFSPAFGIMIACTYFLMYDKRGIEEVVPSSLQGQFKEFFQRG
jgi:hypothetical protein